jgi:hypothetical protein
MRGERGGAACGLPARLKDNVWSLDGLVGRLDSGLCWAVEVFLVNIIYLSYICIYITYKYV